MDRSNQAATRRRRRSRRTGVATLWLLVSLPAVVIVLLIVVDIGNLWSARTELENALEASALAAAKTWGTNSLNAEANWTSIARERGATLAAANTLRGNAVSIGWNQGTFIPASNPNENHLCDAVSGATPDGNLIFGKITADPTTGALTFDAREVPTAGGAGQDMFGVRAQASVPVNSLNGGFFGLSQRPYAVSSKATAMYTRSTGQVRLVRVSQFICAPGNGAD